MCTIRCLQSLHGYTKPKKIYYFVPRNRNISYKLFRGFDRRGRTSARAHIFGDAASHRRPNRIRIFNKDHPSNDKLVLSYLVK